MKRYQSQRRKTGRIWNGTLIFLAFCLASCSPPQHAPDIRFPYKWLDVQGYGGNIDQQNIIEPSGICYHPDRNTLFVVSDEGYLAEIKKDGTPVAKWRIAGDLESITIDTQTGLVYLGAEQDDTILEFNPEKGEVTRRFPINREYRGDPNFLQRQTDKYDNGIESLAFVPDRDHPEGGLFYVGNQWDPPMIIKVLVPLRSSRAAEAEARIIDILPFKIDDPAAMYYDPVKRLLNIVGDADNIFVEITLAGKLVHQYAFLGDNQEGVCVDDEGYLYIAQDSGGILRVKDLRKK